MTKNSTALDTMHPDFIAVLEENIKKVPAKSKLGRFMAALAILEGHKNPTLHDIAVSLAGFYKTLLEHFPLPTAGEDNLKTITAKKTGEDARALLKILTEPQRKAFLGIADSVLPVDRTGEDRRNTRDLRRISSGLLAAGCIGAAATGMLSLKQCEATPSQQTRQATNLDNSNSKNRTVADTKVQKLDDRVIPIAVYLSGVLIMIGISARICSNISAKGDEIGEELEVGFREYGCEELLKRTNLLLEKTCEAYQKKSSASRT